MSTKLLEIAYPNLDYSQTNLDSYYLMRLYSMWGEVLLEEWEETTEKTHP